MVARVVLVVAGLTLSAVCGSGLAHAKGAVESVRYMAPRVSKCLLTQHRNFVDNWLNTLPGTPEEREVLRRNRMDIDTCFGINSDGSPWKLSYDYERMRAGMVRALLQSRRDMLTAVPQAGLTTTQWYVTDSGTPTAPNMRAMLANEIGFCLARKNWEGVRAIVLAVDPKAEVRYDLPKNVQERELRIVNAELDQMIPLIASCVPKGSTLRLNRPSLRTLLEETAFHALGGASFSDASVSLGLKER